MPVPSSINDLSTTAGSNYPQGSEAALPLMDDYMRAFASFIASLRDKSGGVLSSVSGTDTITATLTGVSAYAAGQLFMFTPAGANTTTTVTLNVNSLGAKAVQFGGAALVVGFLSAAPVVVEYDGTQFQVVSTTSLAEGSVSTSKVVDRAITEPKLALPLFNILRCRFNVAQSEWGATAGLVTDQKAKIQAAIDAACTWAATHGGADVIIPDIYRVDSGLTINTSGVNLIFDGGGQIGGYGNFNTITFAGTSSAAIYRNTISGGRLPEYNKTGGVSLDVQFAAQFLAEDVVLDNPSLGYRILCGNDINLSRVRVATPRGVYAGLITAGGSAGGTRCDVVTLRDVIHSSDAAYASGGNRHGLIIDGFVNTVNWSKLYFTAIDGAGLWVRNTVGASQDPQFISGTGLEADYPYFEGVLLSNASRVYLTDSMVHGSRNRSNIFVGSAVTTANFKGGFSSGAKYAGFDIFGQRVSLSGVHVLSNSAPPQGGTAGAWAGIVLEGASRSVAVTGCTSSSFEAPTYQGWGCQMNSGADNFTVTGNDFTGNAVAGINNGAGTSASKVVANNIT